MEGGKAKGRVQVPTLGHGIGVIAGYPFSHPISLTWFNIKMAVMQAIVHLKKRWSNELYSCQQLMIHNTIPNTWLFSHFVPFISKKDQLLLGRFSVKSSIFIKEMRKMCLRLYTIELWEKMSQVWFYFTRE